MRNQQKRRKEKEGNLPKHLPSFSFFHPLYCLYYPQPSTWKIIRRGSGALPEPSSKLKKTIIIKTLNGVMEGDGSGMSVFK